MNLVEAKNELTTDSNHVNAGSGGSGSSTSFGFRAVVCINMGSCWPSHLDVGKKT